MQRLDGPTRMTHYLKMSSMRGKPPAATSDKFYYYPCEEFNCDFVRYRYETRRGTWRCFFWMLLRRQEMKNKKGGRKLTFFKTRSVRSIYKCINKNVVSRAKTEKSENASTKTTFFYPSLHSDPRWLKKVFFLTKKVENLKKLYYLIVFFRFFHEKWVFLSSQYSSVFYIFHWKISFLLSQYSSILTSFYKKCQKTCVYCIRQSLVFFPIKFTLVNDAC